VAVITVVVAITVLISKEIVAEGKSVPSVSPYQTPKSNLHDPVQAGLFRQSRRVVLKPGTIWPSRCFKCNEATDQKKVFKLYYVSPWIYLTVLINIVITIILGLIFRKRFEVNLPLCQRHLRLRQQFSVIQWSALGVSILTFLAWLQYPEILLLVFLSLGAIILMLIAAVCGSIGRVTKFSDGDIWIAGAGKNFLDSLPEYT